MEVELRIQKHPRFQEWAIYREDVRLATIAKEEDEVVFHCRFCDVPVSGPEELLVRKIVDLFQHDTPIRFWLGDIKESEDGGISTA